MDCYLNRLQ